MNATAALAFVQAVHCPQCDAPPATVFRTREEIAAELAFRDAFFAPAAQRDLTSMLLGTPADILRCDACGILIRDDAPDDEAFREDRYERPVLDSLHVLHAAAYREKHADYRPLLRPGARIVEVGSYAGGFLAAAREWGWDAVGVDIGRDTARFSQSRGFDVRCVSLEQAAFGRASLDAVFIWNCFEQLTAPSLTLSVARRILRRSGLLVLRVPDACFYATCRDVEALAYNGLLGWPHRFGFDAAALCRLAAEHDFAPRRLLRARAIGPLHHARGARRAFGWIEVTFRKT